MKRVALIALVFLAATALIGPAYAAFTKDTDWAVYIGAGNNTWNTMYEMWGSSGWEVKLGDSSSPRTSLGGTMTNASAYVRDMSGGEGAGYSDNLKAALDQTYVEQTQVWDNIVLFLYDTYNASTCSLRIWTAGIDVNAPRIKLEVTKADPGTGFTVGQVLLDSSTASPALTTDTSKHYPWTTIDLSPYLAGLKATYARDAHVNLRLTATTPSYWVPEASSLLSLFAGLCGLGAAFKLRREKR